MLNNSNLTPTLSEGFFRDYFIFNKFQTVSNINLRSEAIILIFKAIINIRRFISQELNVRIVT